MPVGQHNRVTGPGIGGAASFHAEMHDCERAQRQISRALKLTTSDALVYFHQARLHLMHAHQRYVNGLR